MASAAAPRNGSSSTPPGRPIADDARPHPTTPHVNEPAADTTTAAATTQELAVTHFDFDPPFENILHSSYEQLPDDRTVKNWEDSPRIRVTYRNDVSLGLQSMKAACGECDWRRASWDDKYPSHVILDAVGHVARHHSGQLLFEFEETAEVSDEEWYSDLEQYVKPAWTADDHRRRAIAEAQWEARNGHRRCDTDAASASNGAHPRSTVAATL